MSQNQGAILKYPLKQKSSGRLDNRLSRLREESCVLAQPSLQAPQIPKPIVSGTKKVRLWHRPFVQIIFVLLVVLITMNQALKEIGITILLSHRLPYMRFVHSGELYRSTNLLIQVFWFRRLMNRPLFNIRLIFLRKIYLGSRYI